ncbi:MAG: AAA family ATPase [Planctomycetes bacterium]|nr:AAA family ATPase [Planctomycetota bacterium]
MSDIEKRAQEFRTKIQTLTAEIGKAVVGHKQVVEQVVTCLLAGGHALLEGVPGLGKTLLVRTLSKCLNLKFSRIQFTPDLMPADILGTNIVMEEGGKRTFQFQAGPIFGNLVLADEVNRATPKTQSALLEAMQEAAVTVAGKRYDLGQPFFVLATQNPIEMEGTYPLPEAQLDRFMFKVEVRPSELADLVTVIDRTTGAGSPEPGPVLAGPDILAMRALAREVPIASHVKEYAARLVLASHPDTPESAPVAKKFLRFGASPRGAQALVLAGKIMALVKGRFNVSVEDIREAAYPALRHRLIRNFEGEAEGVAPDAIVKGLIEAVPDLPKRVEKLLAAE